MITRKKRIGIDSSPKAAICKNIHLLSKETISDTVNLLRTPTRQNRFNKFNNSNVNIMNDESPILSQEPVSITWKWANEGTPIRHTNKTSKLRHSSSSKPNSSSETDLTSAMTSPSCLTIEPETHSPKGLYKFQEEMRKIQFDTESDMSCDNISDLNMSTPPPTTATDTGYPINVDPIQSTNRLNNYNNNNHGNESVINDKSTKNQMLNDSLANDLLNDSDFDQVLLTCTERVEAAVSKSQTNVKKANSTPEIKTECSGSSNSDWNLFNDDVDDLLSNIDIDIPISDNLNNSKFTRHKSMPQEQPKPVTTIKQIQSNQYSSPLRPNTSRKSFTRHESFPITVSAQNRCQKPSYRTNNTLNHTQASTSASQRCTSEEIAEKRRQAIERLKNRNKSNQKHMPPKR